MQRPRDIRIIKSRHFHRLQRRHFILFDVLPFLGTLAALALLLVRPIGALEVSLFLGLWLVTGLGLTVGYHRLFTHGAFATSPAFSALLIVMGSMAGRVRQAAFCHARRQQPQFRRDGAARMGEGWHNNHHAFPYSAAFGLTWYELDPEFLFIRLLEVLGLAWDVKVPSPEKIARRRLRPANDVVGDLDAG